MLTRQHCHLHTKSEEPVGLLDMLGRHLLTAMHPGHGLAQPVGK